MHARLAQPTKILVGWGTVTREALGDALKYATENRRRIGEALIELELCNQEDVTKALATQFGLEYIDLDKNIIPHSSLELIPSDLIKRHRVLPVEQDGARLKVVITDPLDLETLDLLRFRLNTEIVPLLAPPSKVQD